MFKIKKITVKVVLELHLLQWDDFFEMGHYSD